MAVALRTADFIGSVGVDVHLEYTDSQYGKAGSALAALQYLGLDHVRDVAVASLLTGKGFGMFADAGIKFDLITPTSGVPADIVGRMASFAEAHPGSVVAIEGPNEIDHAPVSYKGLTGVAAAIAYLDDVIAAARGNPLLAGADFYDLTGAARSDALAADDAAFANIHPYPQNGDEPMAMLTGKLAQHEIDGKGMVITETGYNTGTNASWEGVDEATQAKLTLNLLLDSTALGVSQIYLYQLLDGYADPGGSNVDRHLGLFDITGQPKQAAVALHNLTTILADPGATASSFAPHGLSYTLTGMPASGSSLVMEKSSGADDLILWAEPDIWNEDTHQPIAVAPSEATVDFGGHFVDVDIFDPLISDQPIRHLSHVSSVQLAVSDHPVIVEVSGDDLPVAAETPTTTIDLAVFRTGTTKADTLSGGSGDDVLKGLAGSDRLQGGDGDDTLIGGPGGDILIGGGGADRFVIQTIGDSSNAAPDQIMDFSHDEGDRLDLSGIDANSHISGNQAFHLGGSAFTHTPGELIQSQYGDGYRLQGDLNGDGRPEFTVILHNLDQPLQADDLIL